MDGIVRAEHHRVSIGGGGCCANFAGRREGSRSIHKGNEYGSSAGQADAAKVDGTSDVLTEKQDLVAGINGNGFDDAVGRFGKLLRP